MSYLSVHLTKAAAHVLMDTGSTNPADNSPFGVSSKALPIPHLNCVFTVRGLSCFEGAFLQVVQQSNIPTFDALIERVQAVSEQSYRFVQATADAGLIGDWSDDLIDVEFVLVGWSERAGQVQCHVCASRMNFVPFEVKNLLTCAPSFLPSEAVQQAARRIKNPIVDLVELALAQHRAAAGQGFIEANGTPCRFGGGMTFFEVTRYGVTVKRLKSTFPDYNDFVMSG